MTSPSTLAAARAQLQAKRISPSELLEEFIRNIETAEPQVKAWKLLRLEEARAQARVLDQKLSTLDKLPLLFGIPYGAKDIICTAGIPTEAGSKLLQGHVPGEDATVIKTLKAQHAILLGKTTTTEFANLGNPPPTTNAWNPGHTPGGSSSGSAAAMGARMALFTLGTQTAGSISRPAAFNGVTALKATYGRISKTGVFPCGRSLDHVGAFTHSAEDAALVFNALSGPDPLDESTHHLPHQPLRIRSRKDYTIGILEDPYFAVADTVAVDAMMQALEHLLKAGVRVVRVKAPGGFADAARAQQLTMQAEVASYHAHDYRTRGELFDPSLQAFIGEGLNISADQYLQAQSVRSNYRLEFARAFAEAEILVTPTAPGTAPAGIGATGSPVFNLPFTHLGVPTLTLPIGFSPENALPLGMQLIAPHLEEQRLIDMGCFYQQSTDWHLQRPPLAR